MRLVIAFAFAAAAACGAPSDTPQTAGGTQPPADAEPFAEIQPLFQRECGRCHSGRVSPRLETEAQLRGSRAAAEIRTRSMPPDRRLADADLARMLRWFGR